MMNSTQSKQIILTCDKLRKSRNLLGITQNQVANATGLSLEQIKKYENLIENKTDRFFYYFGILLCIIF